MRISIIFSSFCIFFSLISVKSDDPIDYILCQLIPDPPAEFFDESGVLFFLHNKANQDDPAELILDNIDSLLNSNFNPFAEVKIIVHGFLTNSTDEDVINNKTAFSVLMRKAYQRVDQDVNIILIDWGKMSQIAPQLYKHSAQATELVGTQTGKLIKFLVDHQLTHVNNIHVIGHSLGAQIAGFIGKWVQKHMGQDIPRITALDASFTCFTKYKWLNENDAQFIDVIHSTNGIQNFTSFADVHFFPNGGVTQPGCEIISECGHMRAGEYFAESIWNPTRFISTKCSGWDDYLDGYCNSIDNKKVDMGEYIDKSSRGAYYLKTAESSPFALGDLGM